jgi:hypothetical protein
MPMLGAVTVTDGNGNVVATGDGNHEYDPDVQVANVNNINLQQGAVYTLTDPNGHGWQGLIFTGLDGNIANFNNQAANAF